MHLYSFLIFNVVVEQKQFEELQKIAASKISPQKKITITQGKAHANKMIAEWAKGK